MSRMGRQDVGRGEGSLPHSCRRMGGEAIRVGCRLFWPFCPCSQSSILPKPSPLWHMSSISAQLRRIKPCSSNEHPTTFKMDADQLIAVSVEKLNSQGRQLTTGLLSATGGFIKLDIPPPVSVTEWAATVELMGLTPPPFITRLYTEVGSGRVGPFYGTLAADDSETGLVRTYLGRVDMNKRYPSWFWPPSLLPLLDAGCGIFYCVDCTSSDLQVIRYDPNVYEQRPKDMGRCFTTGLFSLYDVWNSWLTEMPLPDKTRMPWAAYAGLMPEGKRLQNRRRRPGDIDQLTMDF